MTGADRDRGGLTHGDLGQPGVLEVPVRDVTRSTRPGSPTPSAATSTTRRRRTSSPTCSTGSASSRGTWRADKEAREEGIDLPRDAGHRNAWLAALAAHPRVLQRPIITADDGTTVVGRDQDAVSRVIAAGDRERGT